MFRCSKVIQSQSGVCACTLSWEGMKPFFHSCGRFRVVLEDPGLITSDYFMKPVWICVKLRQNINTTFLDVLFAPV